MNTPAAAPSAASTRMSTTARCRPVRSACRRRPGRLSWGGSVVAIVFPPSTFGGGTGVGPVSRCPWSWIGLVCTTCPLYVCEGPHRLAARADAERMRGDSPTFGDAGPAAMSESGDTHPATLTGSSIGRPVAGTGKHPPARVPEPVVRLVSRRTFRPQFVVAIPIRQTRARPTTYCRGHGGVDLLGASTPDCEGLGRGFRGLPITQV